MYWRALAELGRVETNEISRHQAALFAYLRANPSWSSSADIAQAAHLNGRTVRAHLLKFVQAGLVDQMETFPAHLYRMAEKAQKRNRTLFQRLAATAEVFGIV